MIELDERFLHVNRYGVLSIPAPLWLGLGFLSRHWVLLIITLASARRSPEAVALASGGLPWVTLVLELPALLLLAAGLSRHPQAGRFWRMVWGQGVRIIGLTATINAGLLAWWLWHTEYWERWPELFLASCVLLDFAIFFGTRQSGYIKQIFKEFPENPSIEESKP